MRLVNDGQTEEKGGLSDNAEAVQPRGIPEGDLRYVWGGGSERGQISIDEYLIPYEMYKNISHTWNVAPCNPRQPSFR